MITFSTPARAVRSPFCLTCLRTAPTGGEEGGEPAGTVCARSPRAGGRQLTERGARSRSESGCPVLKSPSQTRKTPPASGRLSEVRCLFPRRTPTPSASNWPRYLPRKLVGGGGERRRRRIVVSSACNFAPRARGASRCMRGAENLVLQEGQAARRDLTRALKAGPPGGAERSQPFRFRLDFVLPASPLGARCTRHTVSPETLPCPSIVKCDLVCNCHLRTAVHL